MSDKLKGTALDGFQLHKVTLLPNNGMEVSAFSDENCLYVLRVDSRGGRVTVSWDGLTVFDSGIITPLEADRREVMAAALEEWVPVEECLAPRHETVLARCSNGDIYQARVCYGMHAPFWCGHSKINFGVVLSDKGLTVTHWRALATRSTEEPATEEKD